MRFCTSAGALDGALRMVSGAAETRSTISILACVHLSVSGASLAMCCTDLDMWASQSIPIDDGQDGAVCVAADKVLAFVSSLPKTAVVIAAMTGARLTLVSGRRRAELPVLAAADFPQMPPIEAAGGFSCGGAELRRVLAMTAPSMSTEETRSYLCGVCLDPSTDRLTVVSCDGHRMAICGLETTGLREFPIIIIPRAACTLLLSLLGDGEIKIDISATRIEITSADGWRLQSKLIDGTFPQYRRIEATPAETPITVDAAELAQALAAIEKVVDIDDRGLRARIIGLEISETGIELAAGDTGAESASDFVACNYSGTPMKAWFLGRYLREGLLALDAETVEIHIGDPGSPARLCRTGDKAASVTLMPHRGPKNQAVSSLRGAAE